MSLVGFHFQPYWSCVPPADVTYGLDVGHHTVGYGYVALSACCFAAPIEPKSPEEAKNVSPFAFPFWKTASNFAVCCCAAPPNVCSVTAKLSEKTVPAGVASISSLIALNRFGKPCTPRVSAGGTASRTMCASGAIAYDHSMSSVASPDQFAAALGPDSPALFVFE